MQFTDPAWLELNPLLEHGDVYDVITADVFTIRSEGRDASWEVSITYKPDGQDEPITFRHRYPTPNRAREVFRRAVHMARTVHFEYDQPPIGRLPQ